MKNRNWFWGISFLLAAVLMIASQTGAFGDIGVLSILATLLLVTMFVQGIIYRNFFIIFLPVSFLYMIYREPLNLPVISPWLLLIAAVFAATGLSIIFHSPKTKTYYHKTEQKDEIFSDSIEYTDEKNPYAKAAFSSTSKYLHSECLEGGKFIASFGELNVYFDQTQLSPEGAKIYLECSFGSINLYIPRHWRVVDNVNVTLGGINFSRKGTDIAQDAPRLILTGSVQFGEIEIKYI